MAPSSTLFRSKSSTDFPAPTPVLFALTPREQRLFYPDGISLPEHLVAIVEPPDRRTADEWAERLLKLQTPILVSAWHTESLEAFVRNGHSCPVRYVCHLTGSVRKVVPRKLLGDGLLVSNWGGNIAPAVAEHALLLILACLRNLRGWPTSTGPANQCPVDDLGTRSLRGKRVGLHGFGRVALALLPLLRPFAVQISAYSAGVPACLMTAQGVKPAASLHELAAEADVFVECEALTPATQGSANRMVLDALADGAVFVNVGRGAVVDEAALLAAVGSGRLRVGVDVLTQEPLPDDSPWWHTPGAVISPHIAGPTQEDYTRLGRVALDNISRFLVGEPLLNEVTLEDYDRST